MGQNIKKDFYELIVLIVTTEKKKNCMPHSEQ